MKKASLFLAGILMVFFCLQASGGKQQGQVSPLRPPVVGSSPSPQVDADLGKIPLQFIPNQGQVDGRVAYYVQGRDNTIYFAPEGLTFVLTERTRQDSKKRRGPVEGTGPVFARRWVVKLDFVDSNRDAKPVGLERSGAVVSYFKGRPDKWQAGLPAYSKIVYRDLWPGIDLLYYGTFNQMKYEFIVHPGADPSRIRLAYRGAEKVALTAKGRLGVNTPIGGFEDDNPVAYQEADGERKDVHVAFVLTSEAGNESLTHVCRFEIGNYDRSQTLVLDPAILVYCGYIGGYSADYGSGIAVDSSGNAYVTGYATNSSGTFPLKVGPDLTFNGGLYDAFVAKVNSSGKGLIYCGYIGGSGDEDGSGIAVDSLGNAYITGSTNSTESTFPVKMGPDLTFNGLNDIFVAKVNSSGTDLIYCGYIGGWMDDNGTGIAVDTSGNAYITGDTNSTEAAFPATVGPDLTYNGNGDAFVAKVNASDAALVYCGYIGGSSADGGSAIAVDASGSAYVTGYTFSTEASFPVTGGPDLTYNGNGDGFVAKVNASNAALVYCGYIGGSSADGGSAIAVDASGSAYVTGYTSSTEASFPVAGGPDLTYNGYGDAFVAKVSPSGSSLTYCGYIGGEDWEAGYGIAVDGQGNVYIVGTTTSLLNFPVKLGPGLIGYGGNDAFIAKVNTQGTTLIYCGFIGGPYWDEGVGIAVDGFGNAYITGYTQGNIIPVIVGPDLTFNAYWDAFVAKIQCYAKNDFNGDGLEDILWRYYGPGGYNYVWYMGQSGSVGKGLQAIDLKVINMYQAGVPAKLYWDAREAGGLLNATAAKAYRDAREVGDGFMRKAASAIPEGWFGKMGQAKGVRIFKSPMENMVSLLGMTFLGAAALVSVADLNWQIAGTGDFNGDGKVDILWRYNGAGGYNYVWYMNGVTCTGGASLPSVADLNWQIVGTGDFNGDGKVDILWRYYGAGGYNPYVWYMNGVTCTGGAPLSSVGDLNWQIAGTGDFNGDGKVDILWRYNGAGGYNYVWYMNGVTCTGGASLVSVADLNWQIAGTGDFNGDGKVDILWRYYGAGGYNYMWYMNGVTCVGGEALTPVPDLNWKIVNR